MKKCTNCQTQNSDDSNFCDQCGQPLAAKENFGEQTESSSVNETRTKDVKKNRQTLWISLIAGGIVIIAGIFLFIFFKPNDDQAAVSKSVQSSTETSTKSTKDEASQTKASTNANDSAETVDAKNEINQYDAILKERQLDRNKNKSNDQKINKSGK